jgi:hypothetical protein
LILYLLALTFLPSKRFHDQKGFSAVILHMIAIALATDRILVLPAGFDTQRQLVAWQVVLEGARSLMRMRIIVNFVL